MSGRNACREMRVAASTAMTCSAGRRLLLCSHFQTAGCDLPQIRASADWPPAMRTASLRASKGVGRSLMRATYYYVYRPVNTNF